MRPIARILLSLIALMTCASAGEIGHAFRLTDIDGLVDEQHTATVSIEVDFAIDGYQLAVCHDTDLLELVDVTSLDLGSPDFDGLIEEEDHWYVGVIVDFEGVVTLNESGDAFDATYEIVNPGCSTLAFCTESLDDGGLSIALDGEPSEVTALTDGEACGTSPFTFILHTPVSTYDEGTDEGTAGIVFSVDNTETTAVNAFTLSIAHDGAVLEAVSGEALDPIDDLNDGLGPDFFSADLDPSGESGVSVGCVFNFTDPDVTLDFADGADLVEVSYEVASGPECTPSGPDLVTQLVLTTIAGQQNEVVIGLESVRPNLNDGDASFTFECCRIYEFTRGDADGDGLVDLPDIIASLEYQFLLAGADCEEALDINDDGLVNLTDALSHLNFVYLDGPDPAAPYPDCGPDEDDDDLHCCVHDVCNP